MKKIIFLIIFNLTFFIYTPIYSHDNFRVHPKITDKSLIG